MIPPLAPGSTILFEGDSLTAFRVTPMLDTWAWMRLTGAHYGYPERVGDWVFCNRPDLRLTVRNGAIGGAITADVLDRFDANVAPLKPAVVVMTIGTNDGSRGIPAADVARDLGTYCSRLRDLCGGRVVRLGGTADVPGSAPGKFSGEGRAAIDAAARAAVEDHGGIAIDLFGVLARKAAALQAQYAGHTVFHDGTHLNPVGHEIAAALVLRMLGLIEMPGDALAR
jgi:lysophospholipase L1-like esterase